MIKHNAKIQGKNQKYPECKVCASICWKSNAKYCKRHSALIVILKRQKRYKNYTEENIIKLIKNNKYIVDKRFKTSEFQSPQ